MRTERFLAGVLICAAVAAASVAPARAQDERPSDTRLEAVLVTALELNPHLNFYGIDVDVSDAHARLRGTVETEVEKTLAGDIARAVAGFEELDNDIVVRPDAARNVALPALARAVTDANVKARVQAQLLWNRHTRGSDIGVTAGYGRVTLSGQAASTEAADWAERIARSTRGVTEVINDVEIVDGGGTGETDDESVSDSWIAARVSRTLHFNEILDDSDIEVSTANAVVVLDGTVASDHQRRVATTLARNVYGVQGLEVDLRIRKAVAF